MFPRKIKLVDVLPNKLPIIVCGSSAVFGLCITIDDVWRYVLSGDDTVVVDFVSSDGERILQKVYTAEDMDADDNIISIYINAEETAQIEPNRYFMNVKLNDEIMIHRYPIVFTEA